MLGTVVDDLRYAPSAEAEHGLRLALTHSDWDIRARAAVALGWRADGAALHEELLAALDDESSEVRAFASRSLGWLEVSAAAPGLERLVTDRDAHVRLHALRALSRVDPGAASRLPTLLSLLQDPDPRVARVARRLSER